MSSSLSKVNNEFRRKPPTPLPARRMGLPSTTEDKLENGLRIIVVEDARLPLLSLRLAFPTGSANDPPARPGLSGIMTNLLTEGTVSRDSREIAEQVAAIGATLAAGVNSDYMTVGASALSQFASEIFDIFADVVLNPIFPDDEIELAKENTKQGLIQQRSQPSFLASEQVARVLFGSHPYSVISPTPDSVDETTQNELIEFHRQSMTPNGAILIAVGDVSFQTILDFAKQKFGDWKPLEKPSFTFPAFPRLDERRAYVVDRPGSEQTNIVIANHAITRTDADYFPMLLMHTILGANASSRLFMNLREDKGYTYGAYSTLDGRTYGGTFRSSAEVRTPVTGEAIDEFFYELNRIRDEKVSEKELSDAVSYLTGVFPLRLETQEGLIDQLSQMRMMGLPDNYLETYRERVASVTRDDIQRVAQKYVSPKNAALIIVGDSSAVLPSVRKFTEFIELFDSSGSPKSTFEVHAEQTEMEIVGKWNLKLELPTGQSVPATLDVNNTDGTLAGSVKSQFGDAELSKVVIDGPNMQGRLSLALMGVRSEAEVGAVIDNGTIQGSIIAPGFPQIHFTGSKG